MKTHTTMRMGEAMYNLNPVSTYRGPLYNFLTRQVMLKNNCGLGWYSHYGMLIAMNSTHFIYLRRTVSYLGNGW